MPDIPDISLTQETPSDQIILETETAPVSEPQADPLTGAGSADDDLKALFDNMGDTPKAVEVIDYEAHYVAALEYKEQGQLDEAVRELRIASDDPDNLQRNTSMLALCYLQQGAYPSAIKEFTKVLSSMPESASTYLHVKYELADAHMQNRDYSRASELFREVLAMDPDFKDTAAKIDALKEIMQPGQERSPSSGKDRVSYI